MKKGRLAIFVPVVCFSAVAACSDSRGDGLGSDGAGLGFETSEGPDGTTPSPDAAPPVDDAIAPPPPQDTAGPNPPTDVDAPADGTPAPQACQPGNRICSGAFGDEVWLCRDDGSGRDLLMQCQGETVCMNGLCQIPCSGDVKHNTNVGCDYFAVDLQNGPPIAERSGTSFPAGNAQFAVVVSNPDRQFPTRITVHEVIGGPSIMSMDLQPGELEVIPLGPRNIEGSVQGMLSYYIAGNRPFVAYQFNPLDNTRPVYSNDASLLLPASGVGRDYFVMTGPGEPFITVVATRDATQVSIRPTFGTEPGPGVPSIDAGTTLTRTLRKGEVLNVKAVGAVDLSGSRVTASEDVIVFGGSMWWAATRESRYCCADHMEQQMIPVEGWGTTAVAIKAEPRGIEVDYWRILAADDGTTITFDPPVSEPIRLNAGRLAIVATRESFVATADKRIQMAQVLASSYEIGAQERSCGGDRDCPEGQTCHSGRCAAPCTATRSDCASGAICTQPATHFSGEGEGLCLPDRCAGLSCPAGSVCNGGACVPTCTTTAMCPDGSECRDNGGTRMCMPSSCTTDADCLGDATCYPGSAGKSCLSRCALSDLCPDDGYVCKPGRLTFGTPYEGDLCFAPACASDADCMHGYNCGEHGICEPIGDPALILSLSVEQYRNSDVFLAPDAYLHDYVSIVAPEGASVTLDGVPLTDWQRVGSSSWMYVRRRISDGVHRVHGDQPVGVTVYGYDDDVAYGYPAGTGLATP